MSQWLSDNDGEMVVGSIPNDGEIEHDIIADCSDDEDVISNEESENGEEHDQPIEDESKQPDEAEHDQPIEDESNQPEEDEEDFPLVRVEKSNDYKEFFPRHYHWASFELKDKITLPSFRGKEWDGIAMKCSIIGGKIDRHIQLMAILEKRKEPEPVRVAYVEIRECDLGRVTANLDEDGLLLRVGITYRHISVSGVDNADPNWPVEAHAVFKHMASLRNPTAPQEIHLILKVSKSPSVGLDNDKFRSHPVWAWTTTSSGHNLQTSIGVFDRSVLI